MCAAGFSFARRTLVQQPRTPCSVANADLAYTLRKLTLQVEKRGPKGTLEDHWVPALPTGVELHFTFALHLTMERESFRVERNLSRLKGPCEGEPRRP